MNSALFPDRPQHTPAAPFRLPFRLTHELTHPLRIASSGSAQGWNLLRALFLKIRGFVNNESDTLLLVQGCPPIPHLGVESTEIQIWKGTEPGLLRARKYRGEVGEEENEMDIHVTITESPQLVPRHSCRVLPNSLKLAGATCNCHRLSLQPLETGDPVTLNLPKL